jgi:hypothetical protein
MLVVLRKGALSIGDVLGPERAPLLVLHPPTLAR